MTGKDRKFTVRIASPNTCKRVLSIEIPNEEVEREEAHVLSHLRKDLKVPGFRKGKVPEKFVRKNYAEVIHGDAVRNLLPAVYEDAIVREGLNPVSEPKFENLKAEPGKPVTVDVTVEVRPDIEIKKYNGVKVKVEKREIGESAVQETLDHLRERMATYHVVDRAVREGDFVLIDYAPVGDDGEIDASRLTRNYPADLSGGSILEEFREGLIGMAIKDEKDIQVTYPDDFPDKDVAGASKMFRVTLKEVKEKRLPELDDNFATQVSEKYPNLQSLTARIKDDLVAEEERRQQHEAEEQIIDKLIEANSFDVPEAMVNNYLASVLEEDRRRRPQVPDEAAREREVREHFHDAAVRTIKKYLILEAIKQQEKIELQDTEVEARIEELATGGSGKPEEVRQYFAHPERRRNLENDLLDKKVLEYLRETADIKVA